MKIKYAKIAYRIMKKETKVWLDIAHEDYDNMHYMQKGKKL